MSNERQPVTTTTTSKRNLVYPEEPLGTHREAVIHRISRECLPVGVLQSYFPRWRTIRTGIVPAAE